MSVNFSQGGKKKVHPDRSSPLNNFSRTSVSSNDVSFISHQMCYRNVDTSSPTVPQNYLCISLSFFNIFCRNGNVPTFPHPPPPSNFWARLLKLMNVCNNIKPRLFHLAFVTLTWYYQSIHHIFQLRQPFQAFHDASSFSATKYFTSRSENTLKFI